MTDKERLELIKDREKDAMYLLRGTMIRSDWHWLIDRVEKLETAIKGAQDIAKIQSNHIEELNEKIERYETALSFYGDENNYITFDSPAIQDYGKIARKVLEERE